MYLGVFVLRYYQVLLDEFPLKICGIRQGLNLTLNGIPLSFHPSTYRGRRFLLIKVKRINALYQRHRKNAIFR